MQTEATQRKLREAQFFLRHLVDESTKPMRQEPEAFRFYLSALLSAGRSVTFALQAEAKAQYDAWFDDWWAKRGDADQRLLIFLKGQRNIELHENGALLEVEWEFVPVSRVPSERSHPARGFTWFGPPGTPEPTVGIPKHFFATSTDERDVVAACRKYVTVLGELVRDFLAAHGSSS